MKIQHLYSKIALTIYALIAIGLGLWGYTVFKARDGKIPVAATAQNNAAQPSASDTAAINNTQANDPALGGTANSTAPTDNSASAPAATSNNGADAGTSTPVDANAPPVSATPSISGSMLAHITPQHCTDNCQAFASDLSLLEYCQQVCGISPIKNETSCDGQKDIQKDYCLKDLAISKEDASKCDNINDANIKQTCKNRIAQDAIENQ